MSRGGVPHHLRMGHRNPKEAHRDGDACPRRQRGSAARDPRIPSLFVGTNDLESMRMFERSPGLPMLALWQIPISAH
jgi:hypothetical protein